MMKGVPGEVLNVKGKHQGEVNFDFEQTKPAVNKAPEGYTWHHYEDGKTMILVAEDIHRELRHIGGQSTINGKNRIGE